MDINLPLILVILTFIGSIIWLYDFLLLKARRQPSIDALQAQYPAWKTKGSEDKENYTQAASALEPVWVRETKSFLPIILLVLVLRSFVAEPFQIPSSSMEPTLDIGDFILVNKFHYGLRLPVIRTKAIANNQPKAGDVMVFFPPHDERYFIKRVVGVPGDRIEYKDKVLYINNEKQQYKVIPNTAMDIHQRDRFMETLQGVEHEMFNSPRVPASDGTFTVPEGHYFMMGDNRDNSADSRYWGMVPEERIVGKAVFIWMHWKNWSSIPSFSRVGKIK